MSNVSPVDGIVTPDEDNDVAPDVWSAAMAVSIEEGIGVRLKKQETAIGLKAGIASGTTAPYAADVIAPYEILESDGCFTEGLELTGGIATVDVEGMYLLTATASLDSVANTSSNDQRTIALQLFKNTTQLSGSEVSSTNGHWATSSATAVVRCVPGDTLHVEWYSAGPVAGEGSGTLSPNTAMNSLSIVLVTPTPSVPV